MTGLSLFKLTGGSTLVKCELAHNRLRFSVAQSKSRRAQAMIQQPAKRIPQWLLATILSTGIAHASPESVGLAVEQIQFCKTANGEADALTKAQLADGLIDPSRCFKANQWTEILHLQLIDQGYKMYRFILAHHIPNPQQQRLEIFVWYSNAATGKDLIFENSCELSKEAKEYILSHPQPKC